MRWRRPIPVVALTVFLCATHFGFASSRQSHTSERDQKILQIQQLIQDHDLEEASREILEAAKQYPSDAGFDNLLGIVAAQQGNYTAAEKSFHQALKREPKFTGASLNLGRLYQENYAVDSQARRKALEVYLGVLAYDPKNTEANYQSAALLLEQGKYRDSLDHISQLPEESQAEAQVLSILCGDYAGLGGKERTDDAAARLLSHPNLSEPDAQQALLGLRAGRRNDLVISLLEGLQKRQSLSLELLRALGLAYEGTGRLGEARAALEKSITPESLRVGSLLELARVARKQQDYQGSLGYLAHARDLERNNAGIHYYFGLVCMDLNLVAEAVAGGDRRAQAEGQPLDGFVPTALLGPVLGGGLVLAKVVEGDLEQQIGRQGVNGAGVLRKVLNERGVHSERFPPSVLESKAGRLWRRFELGDPIVELVVEGEEGSYRIDYTWEEARLRVEVDGFGPHNSLRAHQGDRTRNNALASDEYMRLQYTYWDVAKRGERTGAEVARHYFRRRALFSGTEVAA